MSLELRRDEGEGVGQAAVEAKHFDGIEQVPENSTFWVLLHGGERQGKEACTNLKALRVELRVKI